MLLTLSSHAGDELTRCRFGHSTVPRLLGRWLDWMDNPAAVAFLSFLRSPEARTVIHQFGYGTE